MSSSRILLFLLLLIGISGEILQHRLLAASRKEIFTDITQEAEIPWQQFGGESPDRFLIETMGGGVAFVDFDNDGTVDIFFVHDGQTHGGKTPLPLRKAF